MAALLHATLLAALLLPARAAASGLAEREEPRPETTLSSPDGRFRWAPGEDHLSIHKIPSGARVNRIRLPPAAPAPGRRRVLFAERGRYFCVVDERHSEVGLHLSARAGAKAAKAVVVSSKLHLMDDGGRILWSKDLPETHVVGELGSGRAPRIGETGVLAILLQDADPYSNKRPLLLVFDRGGATRLQLDYVDWKTIEEFALSDDGRYLAVRGFGRIPDHETWGPAAGLYKADSAERWIQKAPESGLDGLKVVASDGWACCLRAGNSYIAFGPKGRRETLLAQDVARRFGIAP